MSKKHITLFTRTPLHVGAGSSVGAIDQPVIRERATGFPIIPGSSLKGVLADLWASDTQVNESGRTTRLSSKDVTWLFGSDNDECPSAGALSIGEARLLAFPVRSARGSFAWITSPLLLSRAARDGIPNAKPFPRESAYKLSGKDSESAAYFAAASSIALPIANGSPKPRVVLEDYVFNHAGEVPSDLVSFISSLLPGEPVLSDLANRLVIVSDGTLSFFARTACEIAQHVRINDATGTADEGGLFNQENVPAETLFYSVIYAVKGRSVASVNRGPEAALAALGARLAENNETIQVGGDATTGLGYCTARLVQ